MKNILIKTAMTQISGYVTVKEDDTLFDVFHVIENDKADPFHKTHRDVIVVNHYGEFIGMVTMLDIFRELEPNYKKLAKDSELGPKEMKEALKEYNLWQEPIQDLCKQGGRITVAEVMHTPDDTEYLEETDSLDKALHAFVMGVHQPIIVKNDDAITGILRFEDVYEVIHNQMLECPIPS